MIDLNPEQQAAVEQQAEDFVLAAAAGSGKTRVLTERYARFVFDHGREAFDSTLAITFTEKAAGELWQRVRARISEECGPDMAAHADRAWISTIHSMCSRLLRRHALDLGIDPWFSVGSSVELGVMRQAVFHEIALEVLTGAESDTPARLVLESMGLTKAHAVVVELSEKLRAMGLTANEVSTCPVLDRRAADALIEECADLAGEYALLKQTQTVVNNMTALTEMICDGRSWLEGTMTPGSFARMASDLKQSRSGAQEVKDIAQAATDIAGRLGLIAAQEAVRPYEVGLLDLTSRFSDEYARARREANLLDFEDLQTFVIELFRRRADIAERYNAQFSRVMIDEFQDTNALQMRLVQSLAPDGFTAVGDERQSIYRFRNADVEIFRERDRDAGVRRTLRKNYRSHPQLVSFFNAMFGDEPFWPGEFMELEAERPPEHSPGCDCTRVTAILIDEGACSRRRDEDEATVLAAHVQSLIDAGADPGGIVILLRAMTAAETFAGALRDTGVEVFVASGGTYFDRPEVIDLTMLLRVVSNTRDDEALLHVLAGRMTGLSDDALGRIRAVAGKNALWSACSGVGVPELTASDSERLARLVGVVEWFRTESGGIGLADRIHEACERLEYDLVLFASGFEGARAWANILKLARMAQEFEEVSPGDPQGFLEYLALKRELEGGEALAAFAAEDVGAVRIMSVHAAKGLEFPITIFANLGRRRPGRGEVILSTSGTSAFLGMRLPRTEGDDSSRATLGHDLAACAEEEADLQEERRLFYVACTRAQDALVLCGKTAFDKPAESPRLIGWLREALGFTSPGSVSEGAVTLGSASVMVRTPQPLDCGPVGLVRPPLDRDALVLAAAQPADAPTVGDTVLERISYSGLALYRTCAYRYYVSNLARLGRRPPAIAGEGHAPALGSAVHALLKVVGSRAVMPPSARIREICVSAGLDPDAWTEVAELAEVFLRSEAGRQVAGCSAVSRERPFAVALGETLLDGVIDLICWDTDTAHVIDYKTGDPDRERSADEHRAQAECYAVAAFALGASRVEVVFVELRREGQAVSFVYEGSDAPELTRRLTSEIDTVRKGPYRPLDRYEPFACAECPALGSLCPISAPGKRPAG